jgi:chemotaxis protein MotB
MPPSNQPVIIIRRKKKSEEHGHHGGAWKVAYADFVTAMMAFFLLLWLLNVTTDVERKGIADYFAPASISKSESGAGGVMGGQTISDAGAQISAFSPPTTEDQTIPTAGKGEEGEADTKGKDAGKDAGGAVEGGDGEKMPSLLREERLAEAIKREEERFKQAEAALKEAIENSPELRAFADQLQIDRTNEGLRIQIIDRDNFSMFPSGSSIPFERARTLLRLVGSVLTRLPNQISVSGHTDSQPFSVGSRRDNWSLSTERANVSRGELLVAGVNERRIAKVVGLADREPFVPNDPKAAQNRRISIVLLRQNQIAEAAQSLNP